MVVWAVVATLGAGCFPPLPAEEDVDSGALDTTTGDTSADPDAVVEDTGGVHPCPSACPAATTPCKVSRCATSTGTCVEVDASDGTPCDDGLLCTISDKCIGGQCLSARNPCDDGIACTADSCDEDLGGCVNDGIACPCGPGVPCGDGNPCNGEETCDLATYTCVSGTPLAENVPCDDKLVCTVDDRCRNQECKGVARDCSDDLPCSVDSCSEELGGCVSDTKDCACSADDGCPTDANLCDGKIFCDVQANSCDPGTPVVCAPPENTCQRAACVSQTGACVVLDKDDGTPCDDGSVCTTTDTCQSGVCTGFAPITCTPSNTCQESVGCDPTLGCLEAPKEEGTPCQTAEGDGGSCDGGFCTLPTCAGIQCPAVPGYWAQCNDRAHCEYARLQRSSPWQQDDVWILLPPGSYTMGAPDTETGTDLGRPAHLVTFSEGRLIAKYEVTVRLFEACVGAGYCSPVGGNSSSEGKGRHPKDFLAWTDAATVCDWLGGRRPSEAEWEYAATGSTHTAFPWGDYPEPTCANDNAVMWDYASDYGCGTGTTSEVGSRPAGISAVGALDMAGNVGEWVEDCYNSGYTGAPVDGDAWTVTHLQTSCVSIYRPIRGGTFKFDGSAMHTSYRTPAPQTDFGDEVGVRCARSLP